MSVLTIVCCAFAVGICAGLFFPAPLWAALFAVCGGSVVTVFAAKRGRCIAVSVTMTILCLGWARPELKEVSPQPNTEDRICQRLYQGRVATPPVQLDRRMLMTIDLTMRSQCLEGAKRQPLLPASGKLFVTMLKGTPGLYRRGDLVLARTTAKISAPMRNPGSARSRLQRPFLSAVAENNDAIAVIEASPSRIVSRFDSFREDMSKFLIDTLPPDRSNLARALVLGESAALSPPQRTNFRRTGTAHLLAVSGFHLALVVFVTYGLLNRILLRFSSLSERLDTGRISAAVSIPVAVFFTLLFGCRIPVIRACLMATSALLARLLGRRAGTAETLALAGASVLAWDPNALTEPAFQLSFAAVLGFVAAFGNAGESPDNRSESTHKSRYAMLARRITRPISTLFRSCLSASSATTPIVLWHFGYVSLASVPANLIAVPLTSLIIVPGLLAATIISGPAPKIAAMLARPIGWVIHLLDRFLDFVSSTKCTIEGPETAASFAIVASCVSVMLFLSRRHKAGWASFALALAAGSISLLIAPSKFPKDALTLDLLDVGQGDSILVTFPNGDHWLVDAGGTKSNTFDVGEQVVVPALSHLGVDHIDTLVLTHPDIDHAGGMPAVIRAFEAGRIIENGQGEAEGACDGYRETLGAARALGIPIERTPGACGSREIGKATVQLIHPCSEPRGYDPYLSTNANSLILLIKYGSTTMLLPGDIDNETERILIERKALPHADVLKIPHHGSDTSSSSLLLDATSPAVGIVSSGAFNRYGVPHKSVLKRLSMRNISIWRTDLLGAIRVTSDGRTIAIKSMVPRIGHNLGAFQ